MGSAGTVNGSKHFEAGYLSERGARPRWLTARRVSARFGWTLLGFLLGAVFWHFVGFWGFVSTIVLKGPTVPGQELSAPPREAAVRHKRSIVTGSISEPQSPGRNSVGVKAAAPQTGERSGSAVIAAGNCSALQRDSATGITRLQACPPDAAAMPHNPTSARTDRAPSPMQLSQDASAWTLHIEQAVNSKERPNDL